MTNPTPSRTDLASELRRLREAATPGEWIESKGLEADEYGIGQAQHGPDDRSIAQMVWDYDAQFIAFAANHAIELCDQLAESAAEVESLKANAVQFWEAVNKPIMDELERQNASLTTRLAQAEQFSDELGRDILAFGSERASFRDRIEQLEAQLEAARGEVAGLREFIQSVPTKKHSHVCGNHFAKPCTCGTDQWNKRRSALSKGEQLSAKEQG